MDVTPIVLILSPYTQLDKLSKINMLNFSKILQKSNNQQVIQKNGA